MSFSCADSAATEAIWHQIALCQPRLGFVIAAHETAIALRAVGTDDHLGGNLAIDLDAHPLGLRFRNVLDAKCRMAIWIRGFGLDQCRLGETNQGFAHLADIGWIATALRHCPAIGRALQGDDRLVAGLDDAQLSDVVDRFAQALQQRLTDRRRFIRRTP